MTKALAYNITILVAAVKSFIVHATGRVCVQNKLKIYGRACL
jgi:hypothetical protein